MAEITRRGTAVMQVSSAPFMNLARTQAKVFGIPALTLIEIPHPLGGIELPKVHARAEIAADLIAKTLKANSP